MAFKKHWRLRNGLWGLPEQGVIMGILNVTPDSFSDGGQFATPELAVRHALKMAAEGAQVIDVGGESTRPGAREVCADEEAARVIPVIAAIRAALPNILISIDSRHADVAAAAWNAGADIINDVGGLADPAMRELCATRPCGIVLMHMQGTPATMQARPEYQDVVAEVRRFFEQQVSLAEQAGISPERICLDPGIGFGKTVQHNLALIAALEELRVRDLPMMMALSRKSFLGKILEDEALGKESPLPTVAMSLLAADRGADIHRVHDVAPLRQALALRHALRRA